MRCARILLAVAAALVAAPTARCGAMDTEPLSLEAVVGAALANNIEAHLLRSAVTSAELDTFAAHSVYEPKLYTSLNSFDRSGTELGSTFEAGVTRLLRSGSRIGVGVLNSRYGQSTLSELKFSYTLPFFGNHDREALLAIEEAQLGESARARALRAGLEDIVLRAVAVYYEVVLAKDSEAVADSGAEAAQSLYRIAQIRAQSAADGPIALRAAALQVQQAQYALRQARHRHANAEAQLRLLAGFTPQTPLSIVQSVPAIDAEPADESLEALTEIALSNRADLNNLRAELGPLERRTHLAHNTFLAPIDITLQVSMTGQGIDFDDALDLDEPQFGVGMAMALGDRSERDVAQRRLDLELQNRRYALTYLEYSVRAEVEQVYFELHDHRAQALLAAEQTLLASDELAQTTTKFRAGSSDVRAALDKQQALVDARFRALESRAQYTVARHRLDKTIGRMPERWTPNID
jgi:outer membrane protein TolC